MERKRRRLTGVVGILAAIGAGVIVVFGNLGNLLRTIKFAARNKS
ncbi:MAG TPA: hypothetical protein PKZ29_02000 [Candidatus Woesebacteria bacterium]|jgi:cytochrome c-type biogenesis protein CcmE|nr:hypothetical protein [Candidatus Woesebacteria bacterium]HOG37673.1 hypothetical protein [Candidatus Woesebacteria bacterium]